MDAVNSQTSRHRRLPVFLETGLKNIHSVYSQVYEIHCYADHLKNASIIVNISLNKNTDGDASFGLTGIRTTCEHI